VCGVSRRHEVDDRGDTGLGLEFGFEDESAGAIPPPDRERRRPGRNQPPAVFGRAEKSGKAGRRIEARPAQPIDRSVAADQSRRPAVADQCVIFDALCHCPTLT
jgi:hypothetical protein